MRVAGQQARLDVPVEGRFGEVGRGDEDGFVVGDDSLGVKDALRTFRFQRARVVEHGGSGRSGPLLTPEVVREAANQMVRGGRDATGAVDVHQQGDFQAGQRVQLLGQDLEGARPVEEGVCGSPDRPRGCVDHFVVHAPRIPGVKAGNLGAGPYEVGAGEAGGELVQTPDPGRGGPSADSQFAPLAEQTQHLFLLVGACPQRGANGGDRRVHAEEAGLQRGCERLAQVRRKREERLDRLVAHRQRGVNRPGRRSRRSRR